MRQDLPEQESEVMAPDGAEVSDHHTGLLVLVC